MKINCFFKLSSQDYGADIMLEDYPMRILAFVSIGILSITHSYASPNEASPPVRHTLLHLSDLVVPLPIGVSEDNFQNLLAFIQSQPYIETIAFFGSRTHFSYGYLPEPKSDLDLYAFMDHTLDYKERTHHAIDFKMSLDQIYRYTFGVEVAQVFADSFPILDSIQNRMHLVPHPTRTEEQAAHAAADDLEISRNEMKKLIRDFILRTFNIDMRINKEALILIKPHKKSKEVLEALQQLGYIHRSNLGQSQLSLANHSTIPKVL